MHLCPNWHEVSQNLTDQEKEYLDYDVEDSIKDIDWTELGPSLFVYAITFIVGILGNVLILIAVIRNTQFLKSSPVNVFLGSLASADLLLISICLPLKVRIRKIIDVITYLPLFSLCHDKTIDIMCLEEKFEILATIIEMSLIDY